MVTIIVPNYNRKNLVKRAIQSILRQTYSDIEILVVDDASTDGSIDQIKSIGDSRIKIFALTCNSGACVARNVGIENAKGDYIAFLDSDDEWIDDKLEKQISYLESQRYDAVFSSYFYNSIAGKKCILPIQEICEENLYKQLLQKNIVTTGTMLAKRECFRSIRFDVELSRYQDWDVALQLSRAYKTGFMPEPLLIMYEQSNSITNSTSMQKKHFALQYLYDKYYSDIAKDTIAHSQFLWSIGMYSLFSQNSEKDKLNQSIKVGGLNWKRIAIYTMVCMGGKNIIKYLYGKQH